MVVPYLTASPETPADGEVAASILQYNVLFTNDDHQAIVDVVLEADADVVGLHELTLAQWDELDGMLEEAYPYRMALPTKSPPIIITDLNITPTSPRYHSFLDSIGWDDQRRSIGIEPTYYLRGLRVVGLAIDHVFVSRELTVFDFEVGPSGGSDHRSLVATIGWDAAPAV